MRYLSPLRYPGGKACLADFLERVAELNQLRSCIYYEPYAGGAGAALTLLSRGVVSELRLNDADSRVYAFWKSALDANERFVDRILEVPLTIEEWHTQRSICAEPQNHDQFEVGFAAFFMNRCNRSGVLTGAGPIGGYEQSGTWKLDVRFNRPDLAHRLMKLRELKGSIRVTGLDAVRFLKEQLPRGRRRESVLVYLDPPYVNKGQRLYLNAYERGDHKQLSSYLRRQERLNWIMSYDDSQLVRSLYEDQVVSYLPLRYTLQEKRSAGELIIAPPKMALPHRTMIHGKKVTLSAI